MAADHTAPGRMRRLTATVLACWGVTGESEWEMRGIVSELVTNSVVHSGSPDVSLTLTMSGNILAVTVRDTGRWKRPRRPDPLGGLRGRGLLLVREQATRSGVHRSARGTSAWAERLVPTQDQLLRRRETAC